MLENGRKANDSDLNIEERMIHMGYRGYVFRVPGSWEMSLDYAQIWKR